MNLSLVQILVVVANIQVETLKVEEEKGFMWTAIDHELIGPKPKINLVNFLKNESWTNLKTVAKGNIFKIVESVKGVQWQHIWNQWRQYTGGERVIFSC